MGQYLPYSSKHSIQEVVVGVHFGGGFAVDAVRQARDVAQAELKSVFPRSSEIHQLQEIKIDPQGQGLVPRVSGPPRLAGFELSKVRADAKLARVLRFLENMLTVNFLEYEKWETTLKDSLKYIKMVLSPLTLATNPVIAISLKYIDRYTFDGPDDEPRAEMLLRKGNAFMAPRCFDGGPLWHSHSGWFEPLATGERILNQLNVGSANVDQIPTITVDHNTICHLRSPRQSIESLFQPPDTGAGIKDILDSLHERNSTVLRDMLQPDMLKKIGMQA